MRPATQSLTRKPQVIAQRFAGVLGAERAPLLQEWHYPIDELVQTVGRQVRHQDEPVAGIGLDVLVDLVGDSWGRADELLPAGDGDDELADRQVLRSRAFAVTAGNRDRVAMPDPPLGDVAVDVRIEIG